MHVDWQLCSSVPWFLSHDVILSANRIAWQCVHTNLQIYTYNPSIHKPQPKLATLVCECNSWCNARWNSSCCYFFLVVVHKLFRYICQRPLLDVCMYSEYTCQEHVRLIAFLTWIRNHLPRTDRAADVLVQIQILTQWTSKVGLIPDVHLEVLLPFEVLQVQAVVLVQETQVLGQIFGRRKLPDVDVGVWRKQPTVVSAT